MHTLTFEGALIQWKVKWKKIENESYVQESFWFEDVNLYVFHYHLILMLSELNFTLRCDLHQSRILLLFRLFSISDILRTIWLYPNGDTLESNGFISLFIFYEHDAPEREFSFFQKKDKQVKMITELSFLFTHDFALHILSRSLCLNISFFLLLHAFTNLRR